MLRLSRKTMLALEAVLDVAYNARPDPVQSKDITARQGIPQRYLEQVMQQLVHHGILKGVRGPKGGYTLARERRKITAGDVVRIVDQLAAEADSEPVSQAELGEKVVDPLWGEVRDYALKSFPKAGIAFVDVHRALACVAADDKDGITDIVGELQQRAASGRSPAGDVVPRLAVGLAAGRVGIQPPVNGAGEHAVGDIPGIRVGVGFRQLFREIDDLGGDGVLKVVAFHG